MVGTWLVGLKGNGKESQTTMSLPSYGAAWMSPNQMINFLPGVFISDPEKMVGHYPKFRGHGPSFEGSEGDSR